MTRYNSIKRSKRKRLFFHWYIKSEKEKKIKRKFHLFYVHEEKKLINLNDTNDTQNFINKNDIFSDLYKNNNIKQNESNDYYKKIDKQIQTLTLPLTITNFSFQYSCIQKKKSLIIDNTNYFSLLNNQKYLMNFNIDYKKDNYKPKGLKNFSLNCYMNSLLQCFYYIKDLRDYFLYNKFENNQLMCNSLKDLMIGLNKIDNKSYYTPKQIKNEIKKWDYYADNKSADVTDLLFDIFNKLLSELEKNDLLEENINHENNIKNKESIFNDIYKEIDMNNIINKLFLGFYESEYKCKNKHEQYYIQNDYYLIFPLQEIYENLNYKNEINLYNCFEYLQRNKNEIFSNNDDEAQDKDSDDENSISYEKCEKCNEKLILTEKIYRTPKILIVILDRGKNKKCNIKVNFDEIIDLKDFIDDEKFKQSTSTIYKLIGISSHYGSCGNCGHYKSICLCDDNYYYQFDDSFSNKLNSNIFFQNGSPYILFYQRCELNALGKNISNSFNSIKEYINGSIELIDKEKYIIKNTNNKNIFNYEIINKLNNKKLFMIEFDLNKFNIHNNNLCIIINQYNKETNVEKSIKYKWNENINIAENEKNIMKLIDKSLSKFFEKEISCRYF